MNARLPAITQKQRRASRDKGGNAGAGGKWIRKEKRARIYARDSWRCVWCTAHLDSSQCGFPTLDHVLPRSQGGTNDAHNLITACGLCNSSRGEMSPLQFATKLASTRQCALTDRFIYVEKVLSRVLTAIETPLPAAPPKKT